MEKPLSFQFAELTQEHQNLLMGFIAEYYRPSSVYKHTAYGLKQRFTSLNSDCYVTEEVFGQALKKAGFKFEEPDNVKSRVNVKVLKKLTKRID